jgi:acetate---CoA ligase (ADP-forming)
VPGISAKHPQHFRDKILNIVRPIDLCLWSQGWLKIALTELERCSRASIKAAMILSSSFAEDGEAGARMQDKISVIARRYNMALSGPNSEGFANIPAPFCPAFSPALDKNAVPSNLPTRSVQAKCR